MKLTNACHRSFKKLLVEVLRGLSQNHGEAFTKAWKAFLGCLENVLAEARKSFSQILGKAFLSSLKTILKEACKSFSQKHGKNSYNLGDASTKAWESFCYML